VAETCCFTLSRAVTGTIPQLKVVSARVLKTKLRDFNPCKGANLGVLCCFGRLDSQNSEIANTVGLLEQEPKFSLSKLHSAQFGQGEGLPGDRWQVDPVCGIGQTAQDRDLIVPLASHDQLGSGRIIA
jgi:hypothetical protein